jgi:hypothetical protein
VYELAEAPPDGPVVLASGEAWTVVGWVVAGWADAGWVVAGWAVTGWADAGAVVCAAATAHHEHRIPPSNPETSFIRER